MAYEAENAIYQRLSQALTFHPASVSLFTPDWTLEPGDVVSIVSGDETYDVPIYTMDLNWNGTAKTDIQSTGNQERQPLSPLKRKEYQNARRGYGTMRQLEEDVEQTVHQYQHFAEENDVYRRSMYKIVGVTYDENGNVIYQTDPVTGEIIYDDAGNPVPVYDENSNGSITGQVLETAQNYTRLYQQTLNAPEFDPTVTYPANSMVMYGGVVYKFTAEHTGDWTGLDVAVVPPLQSQITQNAQEISQKVSQGDLAGYMTITAMQSAFGNTAVAADGTITKAEFSTSVVDGIATAGITADKILIAGDTGIAGALTVAGYLFANDLFIENGAYVQDTIHVGGVHVYEDASFDGDITMTSTGTIQAGVIETEANIICGGDLSVTGDLTVTGTFSFDNISVDNVTATEYVTAAAFQIDDGGTPRTISELPVTIGGDEVSNLSILATGEAEALAIPDAITAVQIVPQADNPNVYELQTKTFHSNSTFTTISTFSRATTLTGGWGSSNTDAGMFSVDADPQDQHYKIKFNGTSGTADATLDIELGTITAYGSSSTMGTVPIYIGTYTESGTMAHQVELNRTTLIDSALINTWTQTGFATGYTAGQANANAIIYEGNINYARGDTNYSSNKLWVDVSATPALQLTDTSDPPQTTTTPKPSVTDTIEIPVTVTAATLTSTYANGTYTVTKSSGGKVSVDEADIDVGVTSYPIPATDAITDGRNSVEVSAVSWNTPQSRTDTTQAHDKYYSISGTVQLGYQTGVDGSGNPVYTNIGNPVGFGPQDITGVYNTGWTDGNNAGGNAMGVTGVWGTGNNSNVFTYSVAESATKQDTLTVSKGSVNVTAQWDSEDAVYNLSGTGSFTVGTQSFTQTPYSDPLVPTDAIAAGWRSARSSVSVPTSQQTANAYINVSVPSQTVGGSADSYRYSLDADNDYVYLKRTDVTPNVVVARATNSGGGYSKVHRGTWSVGSVNFTPSNDANDPATYSLSLEIASSLGTTASTTLSVRETSVTPSASTGASKPLYLSVKNDYVYILSANAEPNVNTNVLARTVNTGYENGQNSVTVTGASLVENLMVYDSTNRTATGPVDVTLSNGKQVRLYDIDFSDAYQEGLDGHSEVDNQEYQFVLEDDGTFWNTDDYVLDVSAVYQQGVEDAGHTVDYYAYIRRPAGSSAIGFYKPLSTNPNRPSTTMWGNGLKPNTEVLLLSTEVVTVGSSRYYHVMYDGFPGFIPAGFFTDSPMYHTPAQGDHGGWYNTVPVPTITGVAIKRIRHTSGYEGTMQLLMSPDMGTSGKYDSTWISAATYNGIQVTSGEDIETYLNKVYTTYYAVHSSEVYASTVPHKVEFDVTMDTGHKTVVLEFTSYAKVPSIVSASLQTVIHNSYDYIENISVYVNPDYASARNVTSDAVSASEYGNTVVTDNNVAAYLDTVYSSYYGTHSSRLYASTLAHKATFYVTYDIGSAKTVTIAFTSYAKAPVQTSITLDWIRHSSDVYASSIDVYVQPENISSGDISSQAVSQTQYNALHTTDTAGTYMSTVSGSYYGRHSINYYNGDMTHKAGFTVLYDDGYSESKIVEFNSYAVAPSVSYVDINSVCHVNVFFKGSVTPSGFDPIYTTYGSFTSVAKSSSEYGQLTVNGNMSDYFNTISSNVYAEHFIESKPTGNAEHIMQMTVHYSDGTSKNVTVRFNTKPIAETWDETSMTVNSIVHRSGAYIEDINTVYSTVFSSLPAHKYSTAVNSIPAVTAPREYFMSGNCWHNISEYNNDLTHRVNVTVTSTSNYGRTRTTDYVSSMVTRPTQM